MIKKIDIDRVLDSWLIFDLAKKLEPDFEFTDKNKLFLKLLLSYFTGHHEFINIFYDYMEKTGQEAELGSLDKGLYIIGNVGCGKSLLFKVFKEYTAIYERNSYNRYDYLTILDEFESTNNERKEGLLTGMDSLKKFGLNPVFSQGKIIESPSTIYIDDFGAKSFTAKSYSIEVNMLDEIISRRHLVFEKHGKLTHLSSNVYPSSFSQIMDERNKSRMFQMFNICEFIDVDWRLTK